MDSIVEARVRTYIVNRWHFNPYDTRAILSRMCTLARVAGYELDRRFARAGLAAGPEAAVAASIVDHALGGGGGAATSDYAAKNTVSRWIRTSRPMGR